MLNCNEVASLIGDVILLQAMLLTENFGMEMGERGNRSRGRTWGRMSKSWEGNSRSERARNGGRRKE